MAKTSLTTKAVTSLQIVANDRNLQYLLSYIGLGLGAGLSVFSLLVLYNLKHLS